MKKFNKDQQALYDKLTNLQKVCVDIKIKHPTMNHADVYRMAKGTPYDRNDRAKRYGFNIMNKPDVEAFLKSMEVETISDLIMGREQVLKDLSDIAETTMADVTTFIDEDDVLMNTTSGELITGRRTFVVKSMEDMPEHALKSIKKMKQGSNGIEIELYDANNARKMIADMQGYNAPTRTELTGANGGPLQTKEMSDEDFAKQLLELGL